MIVVNLGHGDRAKRELSPLTAILRPAGIVVGAFLLLGATCLHGDGRIKPIIRVTVTDAQGQTVEGASLIILRDRPRRPDHISSGAFIPSSARPLAMACRTESTSITRAAVSAASSVRTLCL